MEFMDMLREWLDLRDEYNNPNSSRSIPQSALDRERMYELEHDINARIRGEL